MEGAILHSDSSSDLNLLLQLADKLGIHFKKLNAEDIEDLGMLEAVKKGQTKEYVDVDSFLDELKNED